MAPQTVPKLPWSTLLSKGTWFTGPCIDRAHYFDDRFKEWKVAEGFMTKWFDGCIHLSYNFVSLILQSRCIVPKELRPAWTMTPTWQWRFVDPNMPLDLRGPKRYTWIDCPLRTSCFDAWNLFQSFFFSAANAYLGMGETIAYFRSCLNSKNCLVVLRIPKWATRWSWPTPGISDPRFWRPGHTRSCAFLYGNSLDLHHSSTAPSFCRKTSISYSKWRDWVFSHNLMI